MMESYFVDLRREKEYREKRDLSIRAISDETGLSQGTILRVKNMTMERVSLSTLETLCRYFKLSSLCQLVEHIPGETRDVPNDL